MYSCYSYNKRPFLAPGMNTRQNPKKAFRSQKRVTYPAQITLPSSPLLRCWHTAKVGFPACNKGRLSTLLVLIHSKGLFKKKTWVTLDYSRRGKAKPGQDDKIQLSKSNYVALQSSSTQTPTLPILQVLRQPQDSCIQHKASTWTGV